MFHRNLLLKRLSLLIAVIVAGFALVALAIYMPRLQPEKVLAMVRPAADARQAVADAWRRAQDSGVYHFTADILQTRTPLPTPLNAGRQSQEQALHLEGQADLSAGKLEFSLWSDDGQVLGRQGSLEVRIEGDQASGRWAGGEWQPVDDFSGLFAPGGDFLAYLAAAQDITALGPQTVDLPPALGGALTADRYAFRLDGLSFARYLKSETEKRMIAQGELPSGMELEMPTVYKQLTGNGELWVDDHGLPLRQVLHIRLPDTDSEQVQAEVEVVFSGFAPASSQTAFSLQRRIAQELPGGIAYSAGLVFCLLLVAGRRRNLYPVVAIAIILALVATPLLQGAQASGIARRQASRVQAQQERQQAAQVQEQADDFVQATQSSERPGGPEALDLILTDSGLDSDGDGFSDIQEIFLGSNPALAAESPSPANLAVLQSGDDGTDTDGDGLTDYQEKLLGTSSSTIDEDSDGRYDGLDSDDDGVDDNLEVRGFTYNGQTWYTDPIQRDTNNDGVEDGREWYTNQVNGLPGDTDGDGTPDLFDQDNDGDGVDDRIDLSPYQTTFNRGAYTDEAPFSLQVDNLEPGLPTYVEFQLRPSNPKHLWYAFNVFNWPEDNQGQIQDTDDATFYDVCMQVSDNPDMDCDSASPNANGDLKLIPMLEIRFSGEPDNLPDEETLSEMYGVSIQPLQADGSEKAAYVPLQLVSNSHDGARQAFYAKMFYLPTGAWNPQQVRLVWALQGLVDECLAFEDGQCSEYGDMNQVMVVHTYYDDWYLTGLNIREDHGQQTAVVWEDPQYDTNLNDDNELIWLTQLMEDNYFQISDLNGDGMQDLTPELLYTYFNHTTNSDVWDDLGLVGMTNNLLVDYRTYTHQDEAVQNVSVEVIPEILAGFVSHWEESPFLPTVLIASHDAFRANNLDAWGQSTSLAWDESDPGLLTVDIRYADGLENPVLTTASARWQPYRYDGIDWEPCPIEDYWAELEARYKLAMSELDSDPTVVQGMLLVFQYYYLALYNGLTAVIDLGSDALARLPVPEMSTILSIASVGGSLAVPAVKFVVNLIMGTFFTLNARFIAYYLGTVEKYYAELSVETMNPGIPDRLKSFFSDLQEARYNCPFSRIRVAGNFATLVMILAIIIGGPLLVVGNMIDNRALVVAGTILVAIGLTILTVVLPCLCLANMAKTMAGTTLQIMGRLLRSSGQVLGNSRVAGAVGAVLSALVSIFFFIVQVAQGGLNVVQVCQLIAYLVGQLIMVIVNFVLSLTVIGTIISAILGVIDMILSCLGLGDYTTASLLAKFFYGYSIITMPGVEVGNLDPTLLNVDRGMAAGELLQVSLEITATATMTDPQDWRTEGYIWTLWTEKQLRKTTVKTSMSQDSEIISVGPSQMEDDWQVEYDRTYHKKDFYKGAVRQDDSVWFTLQAGINTVYPFYLNMGYSLRLASCWTVIIPPGAPIPICTPEDIPGNTSTLIGDVLVFDVFPATLDEFFSLEWGDFGTQVDQDGDSLADRLLGGSDPDPTTADADGDGLPDPYEVLLRYSGSPAMAVSPLAKDTDGDGLCDADEAHLGTFPNLADSDLDGLTDGQEVFHQNCTTGAWSGGWLYTYGDSGQQTRVTSDPLISDTDGDGQDDKAEFSLGTNPRMPNPSPVQLEAAISDPDHILGPGQTAVYTVTVISNLASDPPLYYQGGVTTTLPALLGGGQVNGSVNLPQGESLPLTWSIKANNTATTGDVSLNAASSGFMHDGDLNWYYRWVDPSTVSTVVSGTASARLAAIPNGQNPFGVAAVDSGLSATYRQAGTQFASPVELQQDSLYIGDGPGPRLNSPALACLSNGVCLPVFADRAYDPNASLEWRMLSVNKASDCCDPNIEPYMKVNGEQVWSLSGVYGSSTGMTYYNFPLSGVTPFYMTATLQMYEADPVSSDDYIWGKTLNYYDDCEGMRDSLYNNQCFYFINKTSTGVDLTAMLFFEKIRAYLEAVHGRLVDANGATKSAEVKLDNFLSQAVSHPNPAAASDGSAFLQVSNSRKTVVYFDYDALRFRRNNYDIIEAQQIEVGGSGELIAGTVKELARKDISLGGYAGPAVIWLADSQSYLAAFENISTGSGQPPSQIELKLVDQDGDVLLGQLLGASATIEQRKPALAYDSVTGRALLVYLEKDRSIGGAFQVKAELVDPTSTAILPNRSLLDLGQTGSGETEIESVSAAYEPVLGMWVVSWQARNVIGQATLHLVALDKDGHLVSGKEGLGVNATHPSAHQTIPLGAAASTQNVACSLAAQQRGQCAILSGMQDQLRLDTRRLEAISPNQGNLTAEPADLPLWIDASKPTAGFDLAQNGYYGFSNVVTISGHAEDMGDHPAGVARVQVNAGNGWEDASGTASWAYNWTVPANDGPVTLQVRAIDAAGNTGDPTSLTINLDRTPPQAGVNSGQVVAAQKVKDGWQVALSGTASDGGSGLQSVEVLVSPDGDGWQSAAVDGGSWSLNYALSSFDAYGHVLSEPSGDYTIQVRATDALGNVSTPTSAVVTLDTSPPVVAISVPDSATMVVNDTISISGVLTDTSTNQLSLEIAYNPAGGSEVTWTPVTDIVADQAAKTAAWSSQVPAGLEGNYTVALQASDVHGNKNAQPRAWEHWRGEIDTLAPRAGVSLEYLGAGSAAQTRVTGWVEDFSLALSTIDFACPAESATSTYYADPWWLENTGGAQRLYRLDYAPAPWLVTSLRP